MITKRHDKVTHAVAKAVRAGTLGGCRLLVHAGRTGDTEEDAPQATIPDYILPSETLRPDMLLICGWDPSEGTNPTPGPGVTLVLADVAVCCDASVRKVIENKRAHYRALIHRLRATGWRVLGQADDGSISDESDDVIVLPFGNTGMTYNATVQALGALGIQSQPARALQRNISRTTSEYVSSLLTQKRRLERELPPEQGPPCLAVSLPFTPPAGRLMAHGRLAERERARHPPTDGPAPTRSQSLLRTAGHRPTALAAPSPGSTNNGATAPLATAPRRGKRRAQQPPTAAATPRSTRQRVAPPHSPYTHPAHRREFSQQLSTLYSRDNPTLNTRTGIG